MTHRQSVRFILLATLLLGPAFANVGHTDDSARRDAFATKMADDGEDASRYFPLQLGNTWHYKFGDTKYEMTVAKFEKVGDQTCARIEMTVGGKVQTSEWIAVRGKAVYRYGFQDQKAESPVRVLDLSDLPGHVWEVQLIVATEKFAGTCKNGLVEQLVVPAGTFRNVVTTVGDFDANGTKLGTTYYFAKDVGMIKQVVKVAGQEIVLELEKFVPGGPK